MGNIPRPPIYHLPLIQLAIMLPLVGAAWFYNAAVSYSLLLGGLLHLIPNMYFAALAFRYRGTRSIRQNIGTLAKGEAIKFLMTAVGFALVFVFVDSINVLAVFCAFILMIVVHVVATAKLIVQ